jgi:type IV secretion system protein VirD4
METLQGWAVLLFLVLFGIVLSQAKSKKKLLKKAYEFNAPNAHGGASFAANKDLRKGGLFKGKGVAIGYSPDGRRALHYPGFGHLLTVAAARTGKGATLLVNALLSWCFSCIVIDPKAENAAVTGHWRRRFGKVFVLNPFGIQAEALKGLKQARFNPMDILDVTSASFHAACDKLALALVWDEGREGFHFTSAARLLVSGVIAALVRHGEENEKNLAIVAAKISGNIIEYCRHILKITKDPFIVQKLGRFAEKGAETSREVADVIATAITQLGFIGNAAIAESLSGSDFRFADLKRMIGTTVFICLPLNMLDVVDKYFRLLAETLLSDLLTEGRRARGNPVLFIIDEMAQLGPHMKSLENAMGMAAGAAGLQLWCVLQDLSQLKGMFVNTWETFIQNCGVTMWFGARDETTREYVSKLSGITEGLSLSRSVVIDRRTREPNVTDSGVQFGRPLMLPHEVGELDRDEMVAFVEGVKGAVRAKRKPYFRRWEFRGKYRKNPYISNAA